MSKVFYVFFKYYNAYEMFLYINVYIFILITRLLYTFYHNLNINIVPSLLIVSYYYYYSTYYYSGNLT